MLSFTFLLKGKFILYLRENSSFVFLKKTKATVVWLMDEGDASNFSKMILWCTILKMSEFRSRD